MRHLERSHGVCVSWMHEMFTRDYMYLAYEVTDRMAADIYTKAFNNGRKWKHACLQIGLLDSSLLSDPDTLKALTPTCDPIKGTLQTALRTVDGVPTFPYTHIEGHDPAVVAKGPRLMRVKPPLAVETPFKSKWLRSTWFLRNGSWLKVEDRIEPGLQCERIDGWVERAVWQFHPVPVATPARERSPRPRPIHVGSGDADMQAALAACVEELSDERVELKCVNDLALDTLLRLKLLMRCLHTSHEQFVPGRCFVPYRLAVKHKPHLSLGIELALVAHDGSVLRAPLHVSLPGMRTRTIVTLYSIDLSRPIVLLACSEPRNWFTTLARHKGPQVVTVTLVMT